MEFRELTYLLAIDKQRNLTRAAEELYISQSGLTKFLKRLEGNLGYELFRWTGNTIAPTPAGREYLDFARTVLRLKEEMDARIAALPDGKSSLRVGVCLNSVSMFSGVTARFARLYPKVQVSILEDFSANLWVALNEGDLDLIFPSGPTDDANVVSEELWYSGLALYLPADLADPPKKTVDFSPLPWVDLSVLNDRPLITLRAGPKAGGGEDRILKEHNLHPSSVTVVRSLYSKIRLAQSTPAACFLVVDSAGRSPASDFDDYDHLYSFGDHPYRNTISAVYSKKLSQPFYAREFIRLVRQAPSFLSRVELD